MKLHPGTERPRHFVKLICSVCFCELAAETVIDERGKRVVRSPWSFNPLFGDLCPDCERKYSELGAADDKNDDLAGEDIDDDPTNTVRRRPLEKETAILETLGNNTRGLCASELATKTNIKRTTILKRLTALQKYDKVQRRGNKFFIKKSVTKN